MLLWRWDTFLFLFLICSLGVVLAENKIRVGLMSGAKNYDSDALFAKYEKHIADENLPFEIFWIKRDGDKLYPLSRLDSIDVLMIFCRRVKLNSGQLDSVKNYLFSSKPVIGMRTASHAFQTWNGAKGIDQDLWLGSYSGHYSEDSYQLSVEPGQENHRLLEGIDLQSWNPSPKGLYKNATVSEDVTVLMKGNYNGKVENLTWYRESPEHGKIFYTSLGNIPEFEQPGFLRLLDNAVYWATEDVTDVSIMPALKESKNQNFFHMDYNAIGKRMSKPNSKSIGQGLFN